MYDEVSSSNPPDLPVPTEGAYVWHLEVIVVAVGIDPVSREYETGPVADSASIKKKKKTLIKETCFNMPINVLECALIYMFSILFMTSLFSFNVN